VAITILKLFQWRGRLLTAQSRAKVFLFNEAWKVQYSNSTNHVYVITPLIEERFIRKDKRPDIPEHRPLKILYVGRLSEEKNINSLIEACCLLIKMGKKFLLSIIGIGKLEKEIKTQIKKLGLTTQIELLGYIPYGERLINEYDCHDLLCLPSYTEGTPRVVIEAFARGMPVLSTPVGSLPKIFKEEIKFLKGYTPEDIAKGLLWCDSHREEISAMGRKGYQQVRQFLISENALKVSKLLQ
jgi:glycosyltransferase involved in cell wall biosynthesis